MVLESTEFEVFSDEIELMASHFGKHCLTHYKRIKLGVRKINVIPQAYLIYHRRIEVCIMSCENGSVAAEFHEFAQSLRFIGSVLYHVIGDTGEFGNFLRDMLMRINKSLEAVYILKVSYLYCRNARKAVIREAESGSLDVENDDFVIEIAVDVLTEDRLTVDVINDIRLHTVDYLEVLRHIVHTVRESLYTAVVSDSHSLMSPIRGTVYEGNGVSNSVHC